jgi:hypothetical protein
VHSHAVFLSREGVTAENRWPVWVISSVGDVFLLLQWLF